METLQTVVNKLKVDFTEKIENDIIVDNYGIKSCVSDGFKSFNFKKLEIIFLSNLCYLNLKQNQINKILVGNYKNLLKKKVDSIEFENIELEEPVIVNNITNITNNSTINNNLDDYWDQTDF